MTILIIIHNDNRRRIGELEASNQSLGHQASEMRVNMQDQAAQYESKVSSLIIRNNSINIYLQLIT